ncbi:MAG: acyl-CoA carboxylase epsilon subunit [Mycobacteriales bacterium]
MTGDRDDDEAIAAAVVALLAARAAEQIGDDEPRPLWRDRSAAMKAPLMPGRGAWRASALPR